MIWHDMKWNEMNRIDNTPSNNYTLQLRCTCTALVAQTIFWGLASSTTCVITSSVQQKPMPVLESAASSNVSLGQTANDRSCKPLITTFVFEGLSQHFCGCVVSKLLIKSTLFQNIWVSSLPRSPPRLSLRWHWWSFQRFPPDALGIWVPIQSAWDIDGSWASEGRSWINKSKDICWKPCFCEDKYMACMSGCNLNKPSNHESHKMTHDKHLLIVLQGSQHADKTCHIRLKIKRYQESVIKNTSVTTIHLNVNPNFGGFLILNFYQVKLSTIRS